MPQDPTAALSSLLRASSIDDHDEILNLANAAIKADRSNTLARNTKLVALLKLDRFDDAARFIYESGSETDFSCELEKAYALYKAGNLDAATSVLMTTRPGDRSLRHIAAQVAYRAERFDEAAQIYQDLIKKGSVDEENDLSINLKAVQAQAEWNGVSAAGQPLASPPDSFELCYNTACASIAKGELFDATRLLQRAATLCKASDELAEVDKEVELRSIWAQQAYVYAREGKLKEALDLYNSLGSIDNDDPDLSAVARNNLSTIKTKSLNSYLLQRQTGEALPEKSDAKLFSYQSSRLKQNSLLLDLDVHKASGVQEKTHKFLQRAQQPSSSAIVNSVAVINAAAATDGLNTRESLRKLQNLSSKRPLDIGLLLTILQFQLLLSRKGAALSLLQSFFVRLDKLETEAARDVRFSPGLVALAVSLMRTQGHENSAKMEFIKAIKHWTSRPLSSSDSLLRESGIELMRSPNSEDLKLAGSAFEKLFAENKGCHIASAGLVASFAAVVTDKASRHVSSLPAIESLIKGINVKNLLQSGVVTAPSRTATKKRLAAGDAADKAAIKRRRRRLPKNCEEGKTLDPERWLPMRDRSSYRPKNKKGKKKASELTQGGIAKEEETLGLVGGGGVKVEKSGASGVSKKKKKGKK